MRVVSSPDFDVRFYEATGIMYSYKNPLCWLCVALAFISWVLMGHPHIEGLADSWLTLLCLGMIGSSFYIWLNHIIWLSGANRFIVTFGVYGDPCLTPTTDRLFSRKTLAERQQLVIGFTPERPNTLRIPSRAAENLGMRPRPRTMVLRFKLASSVNQEIDPRLIEDFTCWVSEGFEEANDRLWPRIEEVQFIQRLPTGIQLVGEPYIERG